MIVVQTPLRISFLGGGTDFEDFYKEHGGAVLTTAIDKSVFIIVKERFDDKIYINYSKKEIVDDVSEIRHELARYAMITTGVKEGVEVTTLSDIPSEGSGLGSSSSITVALLHALYAYQGILVSAETLAEQACQIEIELCKEPIGRQDQYIAAYGGLQFIEFDRNGVQVQDVWLSEETKRELNSELLLFYTGTTRDSGEILKRQKGNIPGRAFVLSRMAALAVAGKDALEAGDLAAFGSFLRENWALKKELTNGITSPAIDEVYERALKAGALGGKICGAGGGGFLLLYCPRGSQSELRRTVGLREMPVTVGALGSKVVFDHRR